MEKLERFFIYAIRFGTDVKRLKQEVLKILLGFTKNNFEWVEDSLKICNLL